MMNNEKVIERLEMLLAETLRLYEVNGRKAYDSGVYNGVKWAIEEALKECITGKPE
jgi:hypothetical protein